MNDAAMDGGRMPKEKSERREERETSREQQRPGTTRRRDETHPRPPRRPSGRVRSTSSRCPLHGHSSVSISTPIASLGQEEAMMRLSTFPGRRGDGGQLLLMWTAFMALLWTASSTPVSSPNWELITTTSTGRFSGRNGECILSTLPPWPMNSLGRSLPLSHSSRLVRLQRENLSDGRPHGRLH